jgi:dCTP deaminase
MKRDARKETRVVLSDRDLKARLAQGDLGIDPPPDPETQIQPASVDLRLGYDFRTFNYTRQALIDPMEPDTFVEATNLTHLEPGERFIVHPGEFVLATTLEQVRIPDDLVARLDGRSSIGRLGIVIHSTAGYIDPGFEGTITLEISNLGRIAVALYPEMRICQISFEQMSSPVSEGYGARHLAKYQGQESTTGSRLFDDREFREGSKRS